MRLFKLNEGRPNVLDMLKNGDIALIINTPAGPVARQDEVHIRTTALYQRVPVMTTLAAAQADVPSAEAVAAAPPPVTVDAAGVARAGPEVVLITTSAASTATTSATGTSAAHIGWERRKRVKRVTPASARRGAGPAVGLLAEKLDLPVGFLDDVL